MLSYFIMNKNFLDTFNSVTYTDIDDNELVNGHVTNYDFDGNEHESYSFIIIEEEVLFFEDEEKMQSFLDVMSFMSKGK